MDDDSNLVDLTFAGEDLDFLYVMSDKHLYKLTGNFSATEKAVIFDLPRSGSHRQKRYRVHLETRLLALQ